MTEHKVKILKFTGNEASESPDSAPEVSPDTAQAPDDARPASTETPGDHLRAARTDRNLSVQQVATELNLSSDVIRAIEENDYANLPEMTYVQGYLRNYARLVDVSEADVISPARNPSLTETDLKAIKPNRLIPSPRRRGGGLGLVLAGLLIISLGAAAWMSFKDEWFSGAVTPQPAKDAVLLGPGSKATDTAITERPQTTAERAASSAVDTVAVDTVQADTATVTETDQTVVITSESVVETMTSSAADTSQPVTETAASDESDTSASTDLVAAPADTRDVEPEPEPDADATVATPALMPGTEQTVSFGSRTIVSAPSASGTEANTSTAAAQTVVETPTVAETQTAAPDVEESAPVEETAAAVAAASTETTTGSSTTTVATASWPMLELTGKADSWVEVVDGSGEKIFFEMMRTGIVRNISAKPPLQILIGNAPGVDATYEGREIDVKGAANSNNVARFTLDAQ